MSTVERKAESYTIERYAAELPWLEARLSGAGSSDVAAIVGLGRDRGAYSVWAEKTSPLHHDNSFDELIYWGHALENPIADRFMLDSGLKCDLIDPGDYTIFRSAQKPWHFCTTDRVLRFVFGEKPLELKTAHYSQAQIWGREVPWPYYVQSQWQQHVMGADGGYIAVLCDGRDFAWHPVDRDEEVIRRLERRVDKFWHEHVETRIAPPVDGTSTASQWLGRLYADPRREVFELGNEFTGAGPRWDKIAQLLTRLNKAKDLLKNQVKEAMGNCELAQLGDGSGFAWSGTNGSRRFTRKEKVRLPDEQ